MSLTKDFDLRLDFPNGAVIRSRRSVTTSQDRISHVEEDADMQGAFSSTWVAGPAWMFELIDIRDGRIFFICDGKTIEPPAKRFALLLSMFSITHIGWDNTKYHWCGFGGVEPLPDPWMNRPLIFGMEAGQCPQSAVELVELLRSKQDCQFIEKSSRPSELSLKAKSIIDGAYNIDPSIAAIARTLNVSHPHLTRRFKRDFGLAPNDYCHQLRASDAMTRLTMGERIIDVSLDVGYNDLSRFYKQFQKRTRHSPGLCQSIMTGGKNQNGDKT